MLHCNRSAAALNCGALKFRHVGMNAREFHGTAGHLAHLRCQGSPIAGVLASAATLLLPFGACAQEGVVAVGTLPRDLTPWGMYLNADPVVQGVLIGLVFASLVTWTVCLAKGMELWFAKRR